MPWEWLYQFAFLENSMDNSRPPADPNVDDTPEDGTANRCLLALGQGLKEKQAADRRPIETL